MKNYYELTYIVDPVLEEDQIKEVISKINSHLEDNGAEIDEVDEWGMRKFAYEMDKKNSGYYVNAYFEASSDSIENLERTMRIDDRVMRYLTLKYDAKMLRHRELQKKNAVPSIFKQETEDED